MAILQQLGANYTAFYQFILFIVAISFLSSYVFNPYFLSYDKRLEKTKGGEELAQEFAKKTLEVNKEYEIEARRINSKIKSIYDEQRAEAQMIAEKAVQEARKEAQQLVDGQRQSLADNIQRVSLELKTQSAEIAKSIKEKLVG